MCTYLHGPRQGGTYYFRMSIPEHLRPVVGKREFFFSLRTKDRAEAKRRVLQVEAPHYTALLEKAEAELAEHPRAAPAFDPFSGVTQERFEDDRKHDLEQLRELSAQDDQMEEAEAIVAALPVDAPARRLLKHAEEVIGRYREQDRRRKRPAREQSAALALSTPQLSPALEPVPAPATGIMLDTTVIDRWAAERKVKPKGIDTHRAVARWLYERVGQIPVADITRAHIIDFKDTGSSHII